MRKDRNYKAEGAWEASPEQKRRRAERNRARRLAMKKGLVHKGDGREVDHLGHHPTGSLRTVKTKVVSQHANRVRQPPHKGY